VNEHVKSFDRDKKDLRARTEGVEPLADLGESEATNES